MHNPSNKELYDMASRLGGLDVPETVMLTGSIDTAYLQQLQQQFGLTVTVLADGTQVQA